MHLLLICRIHFLQQLGKLASNVSGVTVSIASTDLTGVIENDDLGTQREDSSPALTHFTTHLSNKVRCLEGVH